jgi:hypothetical protein
MQPDPGAEQGNVPGSRGVVKKLIRGHLVVLRELAVRRRNAALGVRCGKEQRRSGEVEW